MPHDGVDPGKSNERTLNWGVFFYSFKLTNWAGKQLGVCYFFSNSSPRFHEALHMLRYSKWEENLSLNGLRRCQIIMEEKNTLVTPSCVLSDAWFWDFKFKTWGLKIKFVENDFFHENCVTSEGAVSHNVLYCQPLPITHHQVRFYANNYFELLPIVSTAFTLGYPWIYFWAVCSCLFSAFVLYSPCVYTFHVLAVTFRFKPNQIINHIWVSRQSG